MNCAVVVLRNDYDRIEETKGFLKLEDALNFAQDLVRQRTDDEEQLEYIISRRFNCVFVGVNETGNKVDYQIEFFEIEVV